MKTKKIMLGYLVYAFLAGTALAIWRTVLLYQHFDPYNHEYTPAAKEPLQTLGYVMFALILIVLTSALILRKRTFHPFTASANQGSVFTSSLLGFLFAAAAVLTLIYYPKEIFQSAANPFFGTLRMLTFFMLFPSALYFILNSSARYDTAKIKKALSFFPTLFAVCYLSMSYIHPDFAVGDFNHIMRNVSLIALVFVFIQETRTNVYGKSDAIRFPIACAALICLLAYEIPQLIVTAFWEVEVTYMTVIELVECGAIVYMIATACTMIATIHYNKENTTTNPET